MTGVGRAYLAWCSDKEREEILNRLRKHSRPGDWLAKDPRHLDKVLTEARRSTAIDNKCGLLRAWPRLGLPTDEELGP
jgi:IclR family transcriptional regulator, mhp operon transcriptional activator